MPALQAPLSVILLIENLLPMVLYDHQNYGNTPNSQTIYSLFFSCHVRIQNCNCTPVDLVTFYIINVVYPDYSRQKPLYVHV